MNNMKQSTFARMTILVVMVLLIIPVKKGRCHSGLCPQVPDQLPGMSFTGNAGVKTFR